MKKYTLGHLRKDKSVARVRRKLTGTRLSGRLSCSPIRFLYSYFVNGGLLIVSIGYRFRSIPIQFLKKNLRRYRVLQIKVFLRTVVWPLCCVVPPLFIIFIIKQILNLWPINCTRYKKNPILSFKFHTISRKGPRELYISIFQNYRNWASFINWLPA